MKRVTKKDVEADPQYWDELYMVVYKNLIYPEKKETDA